MIAVQSGPLLRALWTLLNRTVPTRKTAEKRATTISLRQSIRRAVSHFLPRFRFTSTRDSRVEAVNFLSAWFRRDSRAIHAPNLRLGNILLFTSITSASLKIHFPRDFRVISAEFLTQLSSFYNANISFLRFCDSDLRALQARKYLDLN